jgi:acyl phosphate:glycerol-3-phosphate acyltransferase
MNAADAILPALILPAYVLGSVPFGLMVARTRGVDPRKAGSGNIGATNVGRLLGGRFFAIVFFLDLLKGLVPMLTAAAVLSAFKHDARTYRAPDYALWLAVGLAAILGHMFSVFLKFKGGKGVATSTGVILGLYPYFTIPGLVAAASWVLLLKLTRYISIASVLGSVAFVLAYLLIGLQMGWPVFGRQWPLLLFAVGIAAMITYKHRDNFARLRAGTEHRIGQGRGAKDEPTAGAV